MKACLEMLKQIHAITSAVAQGAESEFSALRTRIKQEGALKAMCENYNEIEDRYVTVYLLLHHFVFCFAIHN